MKKYLLFFSIILAIFNISGCKVETSIENTASLSDNWSITADGVTECGGTVNGAPYKAVSIYMENPTEDEIENTIQGKVQEGYDIALAYYEKENLKFRIQMNVDKGYTNENAEWIVNELVRKAEAEGTYEDEMFVETVKEFMESREK